MELEGGCGGLAVGSFGIVKETLRVGVPGQLNRVFVMFTLLLFCIG
jgi:hypothetical protein